MMHAPTLQQRQFRRRVADFLAIEREQASERPLRLGLIATGIVLMLVYGASPWTALVAPVYFISDLTYARHVSYVARANQIKSSALTWLLAHHAVTIATFIAMAVVNAFWPSDTAARASVLLIFGQALNCIGYDTRSVDASRIGVAIVAGGAQLVALGVSIAGDFSVDDRVFIHVAVALLTVYFARVVLTTAATRARLSARTEELAHAQKGEAVGRLTSGIAHDFNNLLTVMRGNIDLLGEVPPAERDPLLREIGEATERGGRLVGQLLAASRRGPSETQVVDLEPFLASFATFARRVLPANVALEVRASTQLTLRTDSSQFEAALLNLVVNARDAMAGGGTIALDAQQIPSPAAPSDKAPWVMVSVADDGPGMTPDVLARATDPFVTTKPPGQGTGLGLAMVTDFVKRAGGKFDLDSEPGRGTTARLQLPS